MKRLITAASAAAVLLATWLALASAGPGGMARPGEPAPDFHAVDSRGSEVALSDFSGRKVILEWTNHQCPFVQKHYGTGNMQALQKQVREDGAVWLTIISSAPGEQGHVTGEQADRLTARRGARPTAVLLDPDGEIGRMYGAMATPHMVVIDELGRLVYMGAIDDQPSTRQDTVAGAHNYVRAAVNALEAGERVNPPRTQAYGCSVKYGSWRPVASRGGPFQRHMN